MVTPRLASQAGYTLVELMIVMGLTAMLGVLLASGLHFGTRAWEAGSRASGNVREIALAQARLRRAIGEAYPYLIAVNAQNPHVAFEGIPQSLTLLAADRDARQPGRSRITLSLREGALVLSAKPELAAEDAHATADILVRGVASLSFAYLADDGATWLGVWEGRAQLPKLVRVRLTFPEGDTRAWPDLVIAPRIQADVACVFDQLVKSCVGR